MRTSRQSLFRQKRLESAVFSFSALEALENLATPMSVTFITQIAIRGTDGLGTKHAAAVKNSQALCLYDAAAD
jgi:hypothetical protein